MIPNVFYLVTKASKDGTFEVGDRIKLLDDGAILCQQAQGWIDAEYVPQATEGMEVEPDERWIEQRRQLLEKMIKELNNLESSS